MGEEGVAFTTPIESFIPCLEIALRITDSKIFRRKIPVRVRITQFFFELLQENAQYFPARHSSNP
jgi:hypothetical protein